VRGWRGFITGVLGLSILYAVTESSAAANRAGGLLDVAAAGLRRLLSPGVAGLRNYAAGVAPTSAAPAAPTFGGGDFSAKPAQTTTRPRLRSVASPAVGGSVGVVRR